MADLTDEQLILLRRQVGGSPSDDDLQEAFDRLGDLAEVAREVLQIRLANLRAAPATFAVPGEYSQSTAENLRALEAQLAGLAQVGDLAAGAGQVRVVCPDPPGRRGARPRARFPIN